MNGRGQISDRINTLPQSIIENILSLIPIQDALRTSILSKNWKYCWRGIPKLVFDDNMINESSDTGEIYKYKIFTAIFHVLLLHRGPISELCISIADKDIVYKIEQIVLHHSWSKNIKKLTIGVPRIEYYKLPCAFYSLQVIEHLVLTSCIMELPLTFNGFSMLKSLVFDEVDITANMLLRFLTGCPLLEEITLSAIFVTKFTEGNTCTYVELFKCLPSVQVVNISTPYTWHLAAGCMSQKLSTSLVSLRIIVLAVSFCNQDGISSTLFVINSSPNLEKIKLMMCRLFFHPLTTLDPEEYSGLNLDRLRELEMISFNNYAPEREFVKLIMAKSPVLKKASIELSSCVSVDAEIKMLRDFLLLSFPRASPAVKFIIERP